MPKFHPEMESDLECVNKYNFRVLSGDTNTKDDFLFPDPEKIGEYFEMSYMEFAEAIPPDFFATRPGDYCWLDPEDQKIHKVDCSELAEFFKDHLKNNEDYESIFVQYKEDGFKEGFLIEEDFPEDDDPAYYLSAEDAHEPKIEDLEIGALALKYPYQWQYFRQWKF